MPNLIDEFYKEKKTFESLGRHFALLHIKLVDDRREPFIKIYVHGDRWSNVTPETIKDVLLKLEATLRGCDLHKLVRKTIEGNIESLKYKVGKDFGIGGK